MAESMSGADTVLWRIAELGARCGQRSAGIDRRPMWEELERLIADLGGELTAARQGEPPTTDIRRVQRELKAAVRDRDAALAQLAEHAADAVAARRERDRVRQQLTAERHAARAAREESLAACDDVISELAARAEGRTVRAGDGWSP